jgi:hypothetical protein
MERFSKARGALLVSMAVCAAGSAHAELQPFAATGVTYSDNVGRLEDDKQSGAQAAAVAGFRFFEVQPRWNADVEAAGTYLRYFNDSTIQDDTDSLGWLTAHGLLSITPRYLSWELIENYGQVASDPFGAIHPADRQNINYATTGPNLTVPVGAVDTFDLQLRYSDIRYSESGAQNNHRNSVNAALVHRWTPIRTIALNYYGEKIQFDGNSTFRDYDLQSAFISVNSTPRRMRIGVELGVTEVDDGWDAERGTLAALAVTRDLGRSSSIQFYGRRAYADSADAFRFGQGGGGGDSVLIDQDVRVLAQPYRETYVSLGYNVALRRTLVTVGPYWVDEDYVQNPDLARRRYGTRADVSYVMSPFIRMAGYIAYEKNSYAIALRDNTDMAVGVGVAHRFTDAAEIGFRFEHYDRNSDATPFVENRVILTLSWTPRRRVAEMAPADVMFNRTRGTNSQPTYRGQPTEIEEGSE